MTEHTLSDDVLEMSWGNVYHENSVKGAIKWLKEKSFMIYESDGTEVEVIKVSDLNKKLGDRLSKK